MSKSLTSTFSLYPIIYYMADYISPQTGTIHIDLHGRDYNSLSLLARDRLEYKPRYPGYLGSPEKCIVLYILDMD